MEAEADREVRADFSKPPSVAADPIKRVPAPIFTTHRSPAQYLGTGHSLPDAVRQQMQAAFGTDLNDVRVHTNAAAGESARRHTADAFALGRDIVFAPGKYSPGTQEGDRLLAHEITHTLQQSGSGTTSETTLEAEAHNAASRALAGLPVGQLSCSAPRPMRQPSKKRKRPVQLDSEMLVYASRYGDVVFPTTEEIRRIMRQDSDPDVIDECDVTLTGGAGAGGTFHFTHPVLGPILDVTGGASDMNKSSLSFSVSFYWQPPGGTGGAPAGADGGRGHGQAAPSKQLKELLKVDPTKPAADAEEAVRLFQLIREHLSLGPGNEGEDIVRFARFLERNKDKIEGVLGANKKGGTNFTEADIQKIIDMYGKFIASEADDTAELAEKSDDFDKVFKYAPNWQKMSKQDRQMLIDFSKMSPDDLKAGKLEFSRLSQSMKENIALKLVDSWAGEVAEAAAEAFTDPGFILSLVLTIAIYIGLWLTPDPTLITKVAAGTLTVVMWAMFAWEDIWKTMEEYSAFESNVRSARTTAELKAAGNRLAKKIGAVGFDILMMIATWGLGKAASPKLKAMGARRSVVRAEAGVALAASDPATGVPKPATGAGKTLLTDAKAGANGTTAVLDALEPKLDPNAQENLRAMRKRAGDTGTYEALENQSAKGNDIKHYLAEQSATKDAKAQAKLNLIKAEARLARSQLMEAETIADPKLREATRNAHVTELVRTFKSRLQALGLLDKPNVQEAIQDHNLTDLKAALGEAIQRAQLKAGLTDPAKSQVVSNLGVMKEVPGYKTIAEWKQATGAPKGTAMLFQGEGKIYESIGEIDAMVVEDPGGGKPRATYIEEVKSGSESPSDALKQVAKVLPALQEIAAGDKTIKVFELKGKKTLGPERTQTYDYSGRIRGGTRGPEGKGFSESLGYDANVMHETAKLLIKDGLPLTPQPAPVKSFLPGKEDDR